MDIKDQLRVLFPNHKEIKKKVPETPREFVLQDQVLICKYEKRNGKPLTMIEGYHGNVSDFKNLTKKLKKEFNAGGSFKNEVIIIQGNNRDRIMMFLKNLGFRVKRVGG